MWKEARAADLKGDGLAHDVYHESSSLAKRWGDGKYGDGKYGGDGKSSGRKKKAAVAKSEAVTVAKAKAVTMAKAKAKAGAKVATIAGP